MHGMITVDAASLTGKALNWAVAMSTGADEIKITETGVSCIFQLPDGGCWTNHYEPSSDWGHGGPLIEKLAITVAPYSVKLNGAPTYWVAEPWPDVAEPIDGATALIAACRAIVVAKFGKLLTIPEELI